MSTNRWDVLPDFPWDLLAPYADRARQHPQGAIDLSVGTPVDPTPAIVTTALADGANAPGYPTTSGIPELTGTIDKWAQQVLHAPAGLGVLPTIGSKEIIAALPTLLGLGLGDTIAIPEIAYPTYAVGVIAAGAEVIATDTPEEIGQSVSLVWVNSPSNPTGAVLGSDRLREIVEWARSTGTLVFSDECYFELGWDAQPVSILDRTVNGGDLTGLISIHSLSKRSNMAGYRFGFLAGDPTLVNRLLGIRKHLGMMVPTFVQRAAIAAYTDSQHVQEQRARYASRRETLRQALTDFGFEIHHSHAGLYLWATRGENCWDSVERFAERGIVVTPGEFYGEKGAQFVRVALTATDSQVAEASRRIRP